MKRLRANKFWRSFLVLCFSTAGFCLTVVPAAQATSYVLTVVSSGGSAEGTGWTYSSGQLTATASVSVNASDIVAKISSGNLTVVADTIIINANIIHSTANDLILKSTGAIQVAVAITLQSQGGDIILQADSDASTSGDIRLGVPSASASGAINTNGGNIILSGGTDPLTGLAMAVAGNNASSKPCAGVALYGFDLSAAGGDVLIRGGSVLSSTYSVRAVLFDLVTGTDGTNISTSGSGNVSIYGDGRNIQQSNAWGVLGTYLNISTQAGSIVINGAGGPATGKNAIGIITSGDGTTLSSSGGGNISLIDSTNGASAGNAGTLFQNTINISTSGNFLLQSDYTRNSGTINITCNNATFRSYTGNSFTAAQTFSTFNTTNCKSLNLGHASNTQNITVGAAMTVNGPAVLTGGNVTISSPLTAVNSTITINASGVITQTGALYGAINGSISSNLVGLRQQVTSTATIPNVPGKITFILNGKRIAGCISKATSGTTASCTWKPSVRGAGRVLAEFKPDGGGLLTSSSSPNDISIVARTGLR